MVPDELHFMVRITDVLTTNLIKGVLAYDTKHSGAQGHSKNTLRTLLNLSSIDMVVYGSGTTLRRPLRLNCDAGVRLLKTFT